MDASGSAASSQPPTKDTWQLQKEDRPEQEEEALAVGCFSCLELVL